MKWLILALVLLLPLNGLADNYEKVISGAFGFYFGVIDTDALKDKGFEEDTTPRYYSDVGKWRKKRGHEFFNFQIEVVVSPYSNLLRSTEGWRFYTSSSHFEACLDDYRAIITQLKNRYPTLVPGPPILSYSEPGKHASTSYFEGVAQYKNCKYCGYSKKYLGRWVSIKCSIQTWEDEKIIGTLLQVSYHEETKVANKIAEEQKRVFKNKSKQRLEKKGLGSDQL